MKIRQQWTLEEVEKQFDKYINYAIYILMNVNENTKTQFKKEKLYQNHTNVLTSNH